MLLTVLQIRMAIKFFKKVGIRFLGNFEYVHVKHTFFFSSFRCVRRMHIL